jgi:23S rRNA (adenine2503-C2)-methyltransferase
MSVPLAPVRATKAHPVAWLPEEWMAFMRELGERDFRGRQVFRWIQHRGVIDPELMTDLSQDLRQRLTSENLTAPLRVESVSRSADGTRKLLFSLSDGGLVECVLIPMTRDSDDEDEEQADAALQRVTLCISTQVGCAMGCVFCASGQAGLKRGLGAHEVISQVLMSRDYLGPGEYLRNIVFMGMGEPLHHYDETARAIRLITHPDGISISPRRITVSTVGLVPGIRRLGQDFEGKVGLAISLHAPDDSTRDKIIPMNRRFPLKELLPALKAYPLPHRRRITIEYTLIAGINDSREHALTLVRALKGINVKVNLIPMNPIARSALTAPDASVVERFSEILAKHRVSCTVRKRRGDDVNAACGQLALASANEAEYKRALPLVSEDS